MLFLTKMSEKKGMGRGLIRLEYTGDETWDKLTNMSSSTEDGGSEVFKWGLEALMQLSFWLALSGFVCP